MTVFVLQKDARKDFSAAEKYGTLSYLWGHNRNVYPDNNDKRAEDMMETARKALSRYAEGDYLLLNGDPVGIGIATAVLSESFSSITVLKWDNQEKAYYPVVINF